MTRQGEHMKVKYNKLAMLMDFINQMPDYKKYFYCEHCGSKMIFVKSDNETEIQCSKCGRGVKE